MQLGVIGLATMGANIARNAARNGAQVVVQNRTAERTHEFLAKFGKEGEFVGADTLAEFCTRLSSPRAILLMVKAGDAVDALIDELLPHLSQGDTLIDGGNSLYTDTERREKALTEKGIHFLGMGVSGGEEGALHGPSMMPGGNKDAFERIHPLLKKMAADDGEGGACVTYIGPGGSGHFVKMVHNGIEYGVMQLIAESYAVLTNVGGYESAELEETFSAWSRLPDMQSFLLEITADIVAFADDAGSGVLLDKIVDAAGQKGTGKWTTEAAMRYGVPLPTINASVDARILSGNAALRAWGKNIPRVVDTHDPLPRPQKLRSLTQAALELSTLTAYLQGFHLLEAASAEEGWELNLSEIARIWRGGCIIRSSQLRRFQHRYSTEKDLATAADETLLRTFDGERQLDWRRIVEIGSSRGVALPCMAASLAYIDSLRAGRLPTNLIQAQRDYFGAHTYQRVDKEGVFHTEWMGE